MTPISPVLPSSPHHPEVIYAKDQPQYLQLPACNVQYSDGTISVISRYQLTWLERLILLLTGSVWLEQMTFGKPLQPQRLTINEPLTPADAPDEPLKAKDAEDDDDSLLCHYSTAPSAADGEFMYMPAGEHAITPSQNGKPVVVRVMVDRSSASALEAQRAAIVARNQRPYFDFNHEDGEASFWPTEFFWKDSPAPGIYTRGEWTGPGEAAIKGKSWRYFSPVFHVDNTRANPARIACRVHAKANMGGLVNDPAFKNISPLWARNADGAQSISTNKENMNEKELEALRAKNAGLEKDIKDLKDQQAALKAKAESDTVVASQISAKEAELKLGLKEIENEQLKAKNAGLESAEKTRRETDADKAIADAVARGAIAAKDDDAKASWKALLVADPNNSALLAKMAGNPALEGGRQTRSGVVIVTESPNAVMKEYASLLARNAALPISAATAKDKDRLARDAAALFAKDISTDVVISGMPIEDALKAADFSDPNNQVGLLSGSLVLQKALPLMQYEYPSLKSVATDFSAEPGKLNQTEVSRVILKPAVQTYDATPDDGGRPLGWVTASPAQSVDVPIKLDEHVGVPIVFGQQTLASTVRDLFGEHAPMALYALGGHITNKLFALFTAANYNAYAGTSVTGGETTDDSATVVVASTAAMYPGQSITGAGIPANSFVKSITDGTHAVLNNAATATASGLTFTLGSGKVPTTYDTYAKALADWDMASLDDIAAAFDTNEVPQQDRAIQLLPTYYRKLKRDPSLAYFAAQGNQQMITEGRLPKLDNFMPNNAPFFPTGSNRVGFAHHKSAALIKLRLPGEFASALGAGVPGSVTTITDPVSGISVLLVQYVDLRGNFCEWRPEVLAGVAVGERRAGLVLTSQ